jgi:hypothetical protein
VRALILRPRFRRELLLLAPRGSVAWEAVRRALRGLMTDQALPGPNDCLIELPHSVLGRRVPDTDLFVAYIPAVDEVYVIALVQR